MQTAIRASIALILGSAVFLALRHTSLWVGIAAGVATAALVALAQAVDLFKKVLETYKIWLDLRSTRKTEKRQDGIVQLATPQEIKEYAQSVVERSLKQRFQKTGEYHLETNRMIIDLREEKRS